MYIDKEIRNRIACDYPRDIAPDEFCELITEAIRLSMPMLAYPGSPPIEILPKLDYGHGAKYYWKKLGDIAGLDDWTKVNADLQPGGSEGIYVDVSLVTCIEDDGSARETETPLLTFKTLDEGPEGYAAMGALTGMLSYAVELFLMLNL